MASPSLQLRVQWAISGELIAEVRLSATDHTAELLAVVRKQLHIEGVQLIAHGRLICEGSEHLSDAGLADGDVVNVVRHHEVSEGRPRTVAVWQDGQIKQWSTTRGLEAHRFQTSPAGSDGVVRLWCLAEGRAVDELQGPGKAILAIASRGSCLAAAGQDGVVKVWDIGTGRCLAAFGDEGSGALWCVAFADEGSMLVAGSPNGVVFVWGFASPLQRTELRGHGSCVSSLAAGESSRVVSGSWDRTVRLWDVRTFDLVGVLRGHEDRVRAVDLSPDGETVASASDDGTVRLWDWETFDEQRRLEGHEDYVTALCFCGSSSVIASVSDDGSAKVWCLDPWETELTIKGIPSPASFIAASADGHWLATAALGDALSVFGLGKPDLLAAASAGGPTITAAAFAPEDELLALGCSDGSLQLRSLRGSSWGLDGHHGAVWSASFESSNDSLITSALDEVVAVWSVSSRRCLRRLAPGSVVWAVASQRRLIACASNDGGLLLWRKEGTLDRLPGHTGGARCVAFGETELLASGGDDGQAIVWRLHEDGADRIAALRHRFPVAAVCLLGDRLAVASGDSLEVWHIASCQPLRSLRGHAGSICSLSCRGRPGIVVSAARDGLAKVWCTDTGQCLFSLASSAQVCVFAELYDI